MERIPEQPQRQRRNRIDGDTMTKAFNLPTTLARAIEEEARKQGHNNQSTVALEAFTEYLNRRNEEAA